MDQRGRGGPGSWQNPDQDKPVRQSMINRIYTLLRQRKPGADEEWLKKLPDMARRLEDKLYRHASSMNEYSDDTTLKTRLQQIATEMRRDPSHGHHPGQHHHPNSVGQGAASNPPPAQPPITVSTHGIQPLPVHTQSGVSSSRPSSSPPASYMGSSAPGTPMFSDYPQGNQSSYNNSSHQGHQQQHYSNQERQPPQTMYAAAAQSAPAPPAQHASMMPQSGNSQGQSSSGQMPAQSSSSGRHGAPPSQRDVLRQQQQRLLLLRHASKCPAKPGECTATPHCAQMKQLWKHIASCKDSDCRVPHCVSSRFVLSHYHKCTDQQCDVCQPVRAAIAARSSERGAMANNASGNPPNGSAPPTAPNMNGHGMGGHTQAAPHQQQQMQNPKMKSASGAMPPAPTSVSQPPLDQNQRLKELLERYAAHWKVITINADNAKKKQDAFERIKQDVINKEKEEREFREQERQLLAQFEASGSSDPLLEAQLAAIRLKCDSLKMSSNAVQTEGKALDLEVRAMKLQHERNLAKEKELHKEFQMLLGNDPEKVKRCLYQGRQMAANSMHQAAAAAAGGHPAGSAPGHMGGQQQIPPPSHMRPMPNASPPAQTVAQLPAQAVVKGKAKKEAKADPKDTKKPTKQLKKDKSTSEQSVQGVVPNMAGQYPVPGTPTQMMQRQSSGIGSTIPMPASIASGVGVPPPPPSKVAQARAGQPPTPRQANARMPVAAHSHSNSVASAQQAQVGLLPSISSGLSVFHEPPVVNRSVLDTSLINSFSRRDIEAHIQSLARFAKEQQQTKWKDTAYSLLRKCQETDLHQFFEFPVDPERDEAPNYFDIIKKPMDFQTVRSKLDSSAYQNLAQFADDIRLIYNNCTKYNPSHTIYHQTALSCGRVFEKEYAQLSEAEEERIHRDRFDQNHCRLCVGSGFNFEPVTYYCAGPCQQRIRRSQPMYSSSDNRHWCNACFQNEVPESIVLSDGTTINKRELRRGKLPEPVEEGWVNCYSCKRWFHQVCAMLNTKRGQDTKKDDFLCPFCVLGYLDHTKVDRLKIPGPEPKRSSAKDLPETELSRFLEKAVNNRVVEVRKEYCAKNHMNMRDAEDVSQLVVRVVMAKEADVWTRAGMLKVYPQFPKSFNSRQKVILMFEKLDGVDTLIFIMFLQHYGSDCPPPNDRCLYIAYLDSVFYFRPAYIRTAVYHELITSVLEFEKRRGITRCFIWACPPTGGDDYIFHVHPKNQKTPKPDRLKMWYLTLLEDARLRGTVVSVTNLFDEYLSRVSDLVDVPYFEGDCWPTYAEHYITEMEQKGQDPRSRQPRNEAIRGAQNRKQTGAAANGDSVVRAGGPKRQKRPNKNPSTGKALKGRSASVAYETVADSEEMDVVPDMPASLLCPVPKPLEQIPLQSLIAAKIALENERMKDDFIVVKMYYDCVECATPMDYPGALYWIPKVYSPEKDPHDYKKRKYAPPYCLCHECYLSLYQAEYGTKPEYEEPAFPPNEWAEEYAAWQASRQNAQQQSQSSQSSTENGGTTATGSPVGPSSINEDEAKKSPLVSSQSPTPGKADEKEVTGGSSTTKRKAGTVNRKRKATGADVNDLDTVDSTIEVLEPGKNAKPPNPYGSTPPIPLTEMKIEVAKIRPKTVDPDPLMECQIFNLREDFLSLCQGNKYQFDELRRAKHSSMMILYHLHNPESDAFVHTCNGCKNDITTARYTCLQCQDFDLCQDCNGKVKHAHPLEKVSSTSSSLGGEEGENGGGSGGSGSGHANVTQAQYLQMLEHSARCENANCTYPNCARMKRLLEHAPTCSTRISGGCSTCKRYWQFLAFHARQCRLPSGQCKVPHCDRIKGHIRAQANKVADRRMMALMQRSNQSPAPASDDQSGNSGGGANNDGSQTPANQAPNVHGAAGPNGARALTSPRGKGGKGSRPVN